jgi:hypothetical protein
MISGMLGREVEVSMQQTLSEEPATNLMQCPQHGAWLYLRRDENDSRFLWRCRVEDCSYTHTDESRMGLRE